MDTFAAADKRQEALRILEQLEVTGDIRPDEKRILDSLRSGADADNRTVGETGATYRGFAQGATLGAADEIGAGVRAVGNALSGGAVGAPYGEALEGIRNQNTQARQEFPDNFVKGQIAGGAATSVFPFVGTMNAVRGATLGTQALAGGLTGGGISALEGFLSGEGGDGPAIDQFRNRAENALDPAQLAVGVGTGAVAPLAGRAVGGMLADAKAPAGAPVAAMGFSPRAAKLATRSFGDDAAVVGDVQQYLGKLGPEGMIADLGRNTRMQASGVARVPGTGGQRITRAMDERDAGTAQRVSAEMDAVGGAVQDQAQATASRASQRSAAASPLYEAAKAVPEPLDMSDAVTTMQGLVRDRAAGSNVLKGIIDDLSEDSRPVVAHNLRVRLSDAAREARRAGRNGEAMTLETALEKVDQQLDSVPGYAQARSTWADSKALDDAAETGANLVKPSLRSDDLRMTWARMSEPEKEAFRASARAELDMAMARAVQEGNKGLNLIGPREMRAKIDIVFGEGASEKLAQRMDAEKTFKNTRQKATQGSETAANTAAQREILPLVDDAGNRLGPIQRARQASSEPVNQVIDALLRRPKGKELDDLSKILTAQGGDRDALVQALIRSQLGDARNKSITESTQRVLQALIQSGGGGLAVSAGN